MAWSRVRHGSKLWVTQFAAQLRSAPCLRESRTYRPKPDLISSILFPAVVFISRPSSFAEPLTEVSAILSARDHCRFLRRPAPPFSPAVLRPGVSGVHHELGNSLRCHFMHRLQAMRAGRAAENGLPYDDKIAEQNVTSAHKYTTVLTTDDKFMRKLCMNCDAPACASVCPVRQIFVGVLLDALAGFFQQFVALPRWAARAPSSPVTG